MSPKSPAYQWYPRDFAADEPVMLMTLEEEGAYRRLLDHQWLHGSIPSDVRQLAAICKGVSAARMRKIWPAIASCFVPSEDDENRLVNARLERVRKDLLEFRQRRSDAGSKGAEKRWQKDGNAIDLPMATDSSASATASATAERSKDLSFDDEFDALWSLYPKRPNNSRKGALRGYVASRKAGADPALIRAGVEAYAAYCQREGTRPQFIRTAQVFFGRDEHWRTDYGPVTPDPTAGMPPEVLACRNPDGTFRLYDDNHQPTAAFRWMQGKAA